jgi:replicative DNA helicase
MSSTISEDSKKAFANFDRHFQEKIVQALMTDRQWAAQMAEVIDINYFDYVYLRQISSKYLEYYRRYKEFPSMELFVSIIREDLKNQADSALELQIKTVIVNTANKKDLGDLQHVKNVSLSFFRQQGFKNALIECSELINLEDQYDRAVEIVKKSITAGQAHSPGLDLECDVDVRYSETYRNTIKTNICSPDGSVSLDSRKILNGGSGEGELCVVIAPTGVGKSHCLVHIGAEALSQAKNVLHFTFELNERATGIRYDSHLLNIDSLECPERKEEVKEYYRKNAAKLGKLRIKYFPTGTATVNTLRAFIDKLSLENFRPDLVIVDYAGIMRSTEKYELPRMELKKIYEELRAFAAELGLPIWTATQSNREGADADIITLANMSEAYAQAHICDFVMGLGRPESQKSTGLGTIFIAKNRAGIDGISFKVKIDTARSRITILTEEEVKALSAEQEKEEEDKKNIVRRTLRAINTRKVMGKETNLELTDGK